MEKQCPNCQAVYQIDESKIPDNGTQIMCSKCQNLFSITKSNIKQNTTETQVSEKKEIVCPKCGYKQPKGTTCKKCGIIFQKYEQFIEKRRKKTIDKYSKDKNESTTMKCPNCSEQIKRDASICPHCRQPVFDEDKGTNALIHLISFVVLFFILYFLLTEFTSCEAERMMKNLGL